MAFPSLLNDKIIREKGSKLELNHGTTSEVSTHECLINTQNSEACIFCIYRSVIVYSALSKIRVMPIDFSLRVYRTYQCCGSGSESGSVGSVSVGSVSVGSFYRHPIIVRKTLIPTVL
jgi:hypothetical protein